MLLSPRKNGLTSLFKEVRFQGIPVGVAIFLFSRGTRISVPQALKVCEGQKVPQSPKPRKIQSNEKVTLGVDPKVTKK